MNFKPFIIGGIGLSTIGGVGYASIVLTQPNNNLKSELIKNKHKPLSTEKGKDTETWTKLVKAYAGNSNSKIGTLTLSSSDDSISEEIIKLQGACKELFEKKQRDKDYQNSLTLAKHWCISDSTRIAAVSVPVPDTQSEARSSEPSAAITPNDSDRESGPSGP